MAAKAKVKKVGKKQNAGKGKRICPCGGTMDEVRNGFVCRDCGTLVIVTHIREKDDER